MPKRSDIGSILIIGSGPIVIGQACEFDYSGTQACRILKEEGYRIILANSNPATIMTDPEFADATYIEPLNVKFLEKIIAQEKPDAILPTLGGQTALNLAMELESKGILDRYNVEMIGAQSDAIEMAENRAKFKVAMQEIGLAVPKSDVAHSMREAEDFIEKIGLPVIVRPAYILGGKGTGIARTISEFTKIAKKGLEASPINEILIEQSIAGWKEFELEVMRDKADNCVVICSIENVDPMGIHTGDSITVAPAQTLTDVEYQQMRDNAFKVMRKVGVETGGSNVQFAVDPKTGKQVVIEMNPRVSRSSALASKATGFPIAKIAAKLAVGYKLDEIQNDITKKTLASFEPTIDYVVTKIPRWTFEKFPGVEDQLGTQMQSVGEVMSIGRTFPESLQKGARSLEQGRFGLNCDEREKETEELTKRELLGKLKKGVTPERIFYVEAALRHGSSIDEVFRITKIDRWFLRQILLIAKFRNKIANLKPERIKAEKWKEIKQLGFSDAQLAYLWRVKEEDVREARISKGVLPTYKTVDTCAAEFAADTPYYYSTYEDENEATNNLVKKVIILGSGPNRIGQGIEFDYSCVHASFASRELDYESIMVNCNPETVSTDYDTSSKLYFEPLTQEDVANIIEFEQPDGVIVSLGGQTPLKLAQDINPELILGTSPEAIDAAEDREKWAAICDELEIDQPPGATVLTFKDAAKVADSVGFPLLVRPSYVLGGRAMEIVYDKKELKRAIHDLRNMAGLSKEGGQFAKRPILIDKFLDQAQEVDVDIIRDSSGNFLWAGIMEHIEEAGIHSGDSACVTPPPNLSMKAQQTIKRYTKKIADHLGVIGLLNVQFAVQNEKVYVIEANPRASRTVPFLAKATGVPLAKIATHVMLGKTLPEIERSGINTIPKNSNYSSVKEAVMPFNRFDGADQLLGPEMKSTGEAMGIDVSPELAFIKSQLSAWLKVPRYGTVFLSVADGDKPMALKTATIFSELGFALAATEGTANFLEKNELLVAIHVAKLEESKGGTDAIKLIHGGAVQLVINSPEGRTAQADGNHIRSAALDRRILCYTTIRAGLAAAEGLKEIRHKRFTVEPLQRRYTSASSFDTI